MPLGRSRRDEFCFPHFGSGRGGRTRPRARPRRPAGAVEVFDGNKPRRAEFLRIMDQSGPTLKAFV